MANAISTGAPSADAAVPAVFVTIPLFKLKESLLLAKSRLAADTARRKAIRLAGDDYALADAISDAALTAEAFGRSSMIFNRHAMGGAK